MPVTKPIAVVGLGAILPDAPDVASFWQQIKNGHYAITDVPENRWDPTLYYDPDPEATDKTYSKIGAWVRGFKLDPFKMGIAIPPRVIEQMDEVQQWAIAAAHQALSHYGYPKRKLDQSRTAVILGNALGGEKHYISTMRIRTPEFMQALSVVPEFKDLPAAVQQALLIGMRDNIRLAIPGITEDTMPGELGNIIAGRVANVFNFQGPNFVTDAACASSLAALQASVEGLNNYQFDAVLTGGADRMMGVEGFVKFCKIGALSPDGSRPYADGANGFVMGEGTAVLLLKRLEDAERDGDEIYAVVRGIGSSSDGKGKGITAPNPTGQEQALVRAWKNVGVHPATVGLIEGHGTSTRVGDVVEVNSLNTIFGQYGLPNGKIALGSVKSNIGHLKSAAGAAGLLKAVLSLHEKVLPPSVNFNKPNPNIDFSQIPFAVNTQLRPWEVKKDEVRRAGISSFGFGGTNFHVVMDEYIPGILAPERPVFQGMDFAAAAVQVFPETLEPVLAETAVKEAVGGVRPYQGLFFISADSTAQLKEKLAASLVQIQHGSIPPSVLPDAEELARAERLAIDYVDAAELLKRAERALKGFDTDGNPWQALVAHGVFRGSGSVGKVAFLFPGQGSQYVNMLKDLCEVEPVVADTFAEADRIMLPILGQTLTSYIYVDGSVEAVAEAEKALRNTEITQPAMLTADVAMLRLMQKFGFEPDMVIGHSLGEYAGLVAAGVLTFAEALEAVSARGQEMKKVSWDDNGCMAAVSAPLGEVEKIIQAVDGYVVIANINSPLQCVIGGTTEGVDAAMEAFKLAGYQGTKIPVSHAFHTRIVEPASGPLREVISRMSVKPPRTAIVANVSGAEYPKTRDEIIDVLARQVASPVQFIKGIETLQRLGGRVFVEIGPKRVLNALATDILKGQSGITILATNHPREGAVVSFNKALCGLFAAGVVPQQPAQVETAEVSAVAGKSVRMDEAEVKKFALQMVSEKTGYPVEMLDMDLDLEADLGIDTVKQAELFASIRTHYQIARREDLRLSDYNTLDKVVGFIRDALTQGLGMAVEMAAEIPERITAPLMTTAAPAPVGVKRAGSPVLIQRGVTDGRQPLTGSVVISGAGLGLPGLGGAVFDDDNIRSILNGEIRIEPLPDGMRQLMLEKRVTRLIKSEAGAVMQPIDQMDQTVKLGGQRGSFDLAEEFGVPADRVEATDIATQLAIAAGIEALRDAGIPLVMAYRQTSKGTFLPDRWRLPESMADETGVIFGSAFPGLDSMAGEAIKFYQYQGIEKQIVEVQSILDLVPVNQSDLRGTLDRRLIELHAELARLDYHFDRRFVFRILSMGHSQFAEYIGARGPNTHVNAACATTTHAVSVAEDWIRSGRARRVIVVAGDDVTSGPLADWVGTGLMASGAATIEGDPRMAILPFDRRRNGMIMGMGAAALVVESEDAVRERGMRGICEVLATQIANSAYHGTRLDTQHVGAVMERLVAQAEERFGLRRTEMAGQTVFVSHETYTPARGGSASAEIRALRGVFKDQANQVVIANTKGYTGHTMGVGVEDVVAVKTLEYGIVPPIANIQHGFEPDPDLGDLRLSRGGPQNVHYALRLGAGFGSQIAMSLLRKINSEGERISRPEYQNWLAAVCGYDHAELVVEKRTLRVRHDGPPARAPRKSTWEFGQGPTLWAEAETIEVEHLPAVPVQSSDNGTGRSNGAHPAPAEVVHPAITGSPDGDEVKVFVLQAVSEKTGYPVEMLDLDLDLEADLGIDTVKQAELFATIRTHFDIPRREDLRLSDYNTLAKVIEFMQGALGEAVAVPTPATVGVPPLVESTGDVSDGSSIVNVHDFVLEAVSEKTGYPVEMLDLELDLEADLGIDTVKQAELFATIRGHFNIPRREDLRLSDYNNLSKVIGFMEDALAVQQVPAGPDPVIGADSVLLGAMEEESVHLAAESMANHKDTESMNGIISRRVPVMVLRPRPDLCTPTGVVIDQESRILIVGDQSKTGENLARKLRAQKAQVLVLSGSDPEAMLKQAAGFNHEGKIQGVYFLSALDTEPPLAQMSSATWRLEIERRADTLFNLIRSIDGEPFLVCATRMGGLLGFGSDGASAPMGGLVSGFAKALAWERLESLVKVADFETNASPASISTRLVAETLYDPAVVEVGWKGELRYSPSLADQPGGAANFDLTQDTVYVISGGSGGIIAPIVLDLAKETGGHFYLLSRSALPDPADTDLAAMQTDRNAFKLHLAQTLREKGEKSSPAVVEQKLAALDRAAAAIEMMAKVRLTGAKIEYLVCDVTDPQACEDSIRQIVEKTGQVDVFIHAAGIEHSRKLESKPVDEFRQTISVKADGFFNLYKAMQKADRLPKAVVFFGSLAGRFGNKGQTDYSAANDLLSKLALALPVQTPGVKSLSLDWGAWAEVGMASRGFIPDLMQRAGIDLLQPDQAAPLVRQELVFGPRVGEVLLAGSLGLLSQPRMQGGLDLEKANLALLSGKTSQKLAVHVTGFSLEQGISLEAELDPNVEPYLRDHALNGIPLLPGVMGIEGLSSASRHIADALATEKGGFEVSGLEDIQFIAPFKFYRNQPRRAIWKARVVVEGEALIADARLESILTRYGQDPEPMLHFTARVRLDPASSKTSRDSVDAPHWNGNLSLSAEEIYKLYFHGPAFQVLEAVQQDGQEVLGKLQRQLPALTAQEQNMLTSPLLVELCLQTAGVWEIGKTGTLVLPRSIGRMKVFHPSIQDRALFARVKPHECGDGLFCFDAWVVDAKGRVYLEIEDYRTAPLPYALENEQLAPLRSWMVDQSR